MQGFYLCYFYRIKYRANDVARNAMNIKLIMIVRIENEPNTLKIQPKTDRNITAPPIRMEHKIITSLGTYYTVNAKYNGSCKTISIKNINPNITASTMVLCIERVISINIMHPKICIPKLSVTSRFNSVLQHQIRQYNPNTIYPILKAIGPTTSLLKTDQQAIPRAKPAQLPKVYPISKLYLVSKNLTKGSRVK